jgi:mono/diheme cytochrome c family protein
MSLLKSAFLILTLAPSSAWGGSEVERGRLLVEANCSSCHAIGLNDASRHPDAPPFRTLSERYPINSLAETLAKGVPIEHPDMPDFLVTASQIDEILAYIISVQPAWRPTPGRPR